MDSLPPAISIQELFLASKFDPTLKVVKECLHTGNWENAPKSFQLLNDQLCQKRGLLVRNNPIIIPNVMRHRILQVAHEGHQGVTKVKQHLMQRVWWPGMDLQPERYV